MSNLNPKQFKVQKAGGPGEYRSTFGHEIRAHDFGYGTEWTVSDPGYTEINIDPFATKKEAVAHAKEQVDKHATGEWNHDEHIKAKLGLPNTCGCLEHWKR